MGARHQTLRCNLAGPEPLGRMATSMALGVSRKPSHRVTLTVGTGSQATTTPRIAPCGVPGAMLHRKSTLPHGFEYGLRHTGQDMHTRYVFASKWVKKLFIKLLRMRHKCGSASATSSDCSAVTIPDMDSTVRVSLASKKTVYSNTAGGVDVVVR